MSNCGCDDLCRSLSLLTGDKGDAGANGLDGTFGANADLYIFSTATVGNPTNTKLIFDNANLSAATSISVSNVDGYGNTVAGWLNLVATSNATLKAFIRVNKEFDSTAFAMYAVTAQTANAGYYTYTITYVGGSSNSPFALNDNVIFSYVISGNNGAAGTSGTTLIPLTYPQVSNTAVGTDTFTFNIPANTLANTGDVVEFEADVQIDLILPSPPPNFDTQTIAITNNGTSVIYVTNIPYVGYTSSAKVRMRVIRTGATASVETQEMLTVIPSNGLFSIANAGANFAAAIPLVITVTNNVVSGASAPYATITNAIMKYLPA